MLYLEFMSKETLDVAKSHLNWMNFKGRHYFQDIDDNPFSFKNIQVIKTFEELEEELKQQRPRVFLTSASTLDIGLVRKILRDFLSKTKNMIVFTSVRNLPEHCLA